MTYAPREAGRSSKERQTRGAFVRGAFVRGAFVRGAFVRGALVLVGCVLAAITVPLTMGNTGCATTPVLKGPGEPCTRTSECQSSLSCSSGVCTAGPGVDAAILRDAGTDAPLPSDASALDASAFDAGPDPIDAALDDAAAEDDAAL
jgi:hypothetical protein